VSGPPPVPPGNKPRDHGGIETKFKFRFESKDITLTAVLAASYVVMNIIQMISIGNPTTFGPIQLRVADCLIALSALFGLPAIIGVTTGCFLTNAYYFLGPVDLVLGPVANLVAATVVFTLRRHRLLACVAGALPIGVIVGSYLPFFFPPPEILGSFPVLAAMILSVTASSIVAIGVIGYFLLAALSEPNVLKPLRSHGLKTVNDG
jgi:uncharacterized membrane protein